MIEYVEMLIYHHWNEIRLLAALRYQFRILKLRYASVLNNCDCEYQQLFEREIWYL